MSGAADTLFEAADASHGPLLRALFEREQVPCHCRYWHFTGDKNAWLERCFHFPEQNAAELDAALAAANPPLEGVVARSRDRALGWMKLTPAARVNKVYEQRLYRGLPCFNGDRAGIYTVGCFLVDNEARRQGIANGLLSRGVELARRAGARGIEAFPRGGEGLAPEEQWTGPLTLFERHGFQIVNDFKPYPVLRLEL